MATKWILWRLGLFFFLKATVYTHSIRQHPVCQQIHTFISLYLYDINDLDLVVQTSFELNQTSTPNMNHVRFNNKTLHKLVIYILDTLSGKWHIIFVNNMLFLLHAVDGYRYHAISIGFAKV